MRSKPTILLLHGAIASQTQLSPLKSLLEERMDVHSFDFCGHGANSLIEGKFDMTCFAHEIIDYVENKGLVDVHLFGYSMGGYAAFVAAQIRPELFASIITLGTKFDWTLETVHNETRLLDADKILEKVPRFAEHLRIIHVNNPWQDVLCNTKKMMESLALRPLLTQGSMHLPGCKKLIINGSEDQTANPEKSYEFAQDCGAHFILLKNTSHPFEKVNIENLYKLIETFVFEGSFETKS